MSQAALATYPVIRQAVTKPFFSASINGTSDPRYNVKLPPPLEFRATSTPKLEWVDYPEGTYLRLSADHTENGLTRSFQIVFYVKPSSGSLKIEESDIIALTYYSDPLNGTLHIGVSGTLDLKYNEVDETLTGSFDGIFDHGGEHGTERFPINGKFVANGCRWTREKKAFKK